MLRNSPKMSAGMIYWRGAATYCFHSSILVFINNVWNNRLHSGL